MRKQKKAKYLLIIFHFIYVVNSYSQSSSSNDDNNYCINNYFIKLYNNPNLSLEPGSIAIDNNSTITCGLVRLSNASDYSDGYLMKVDATGNIVWQKTFGGVGSQGFGRVIKLADGNFVATGFDATDFNINYFLLKFDPNGNIIWRKDFGTSNSIENFSVTDVAENIDGALIITAFNIENNPMGNFRILFAKFDSKGNIVLSKFFVPPYDAYAAMMFPNSLVIKNGYTYIAGNVIINSLKGLLMKINNSSGNLEWSKVYDFNTGEADFSKVLNYSDNKLCLIGSNKLNPADTSIIYIVDTAGVPSSIKYFQFTTLFNGGHGMPGTALLDKNKNLIWTMMNVTSQRADMTISKINPLTGVLWAKEYKQLSGPPRPSSIQFDNDSSIYTGGYNVNSSGHLQYYLCKFTKEGEAGCTADDLKTSFGEGVSEVRKVKFSLVNKSLIEKNGTTKITANYLSLADSLCVISSVSTIKLSGSQIICDIKKTIEVQVATNAITAPLLRFEYDTLYLKLLSFSNSVAKFIASKAGSYLIRAKLETSCKVIEDSIKVNIFPSAYSLNLGNDTFICPNQDLYLNTHVQFKSYKWKNGSSDSFFLAKASGQYYVTVSDYCNNSKTDTIVVLPATNVSFDFLPLYSKCNSDTISIHISSDLNNYVFQPSINSNYSNNEIKVWSNADLNYFIKATTSQGCLVSDSLRIKVSHSSPIYLKNDTTICEGDTVVLKAPDGFESYTWNDGSNTKEHIVKITGKSWLYAVDSNNCVSSDTTNVFMNSKPALFLGTDTTICSNDKYTIKPGNSFVSYLWQDGTKNTNYTTTSLGIYWVKVTDSKGCTNTDTVRIIGYKSIPINFLKNIDSICVFEPKDIYALGNWSTYLWNNSLPTSYITIGKPGTYTLEVSNKEGCFAKDTIKVINKECISGIYFPSAFTPNDDGKNDLFKPIVHTSVAKYHFAIFNRFGQLVFETTSSTMGWNGKLNSADQDTGTFVWYCQYQMQGQIERKEKGTLVLFR